MISDVFLRVLELVLTSSIIILIMAGLFAIKGLNLSPKLRYSLWLLTLISILVPFRPRFGNALVNIEQEIPPLNTSISQTSNVAETASNQLPLLTNLPWQELIIGIWILGILIKIGKQIYAYHQFKKSINRWGKPITDERFALILFELQDLLGITREVPLIHYPLATSPMMTGFKNPIILLPSLDYTDEELELVLEHELTHLKHNDMYANLLITLVGSVYWFNPLVNFAIKESQDAGEAYCDADVLNYRDQEYRTFYGETIISMIERSQKPPIALTTCFYSNKHKLKRRIVSIMNQNVPKKSVTALVSLLVIGLLVFSGNMITFSLTRQATSITNKNSFNEQAALDIALTDAKLDINQITNPSVSTKKETYVITFTDKETTYLYNISKKSQKITLKQKETVTTKEIKQQVETVPKTDLENHPNQKTTETSNHGETQTTAVTPQVTTIPSAGNQDNTGPVIEPIIPPTTDDNDFEDNDDTETDED